MIVSSADLSNSDKTDGFLKQTHALTRNDFSGAFLQAGVAELTMACLCLGMALHGGVIAACATFFVFSDYMKPAIRMAALMQLPVKFIWSHDAFRVGEDGPTHEPVEQEAQLRLMEKLKNHSGQNSMFATLQSVYTDLGISVYETILKTYPNMYFVSAIELDKAENDKNVVYFIGESYSGGIVETTKLGYSELALMGNVVQSDYGYSQAMSAGTCGALVYKPAFIVRFKDA